MKRGWRCDLCKKARARKGLLLCQSCFEALSRIAGIWFAIPEEARKVILETHRAKFPDDKGPTPGVLDTDKLEKQLKARGAAAGSDTTLEVTPVRILPGE